MLGPRILMLGPRFPTDVGGRRPSYFFLVKFTLNEGSGDRKDCMKRELVLAMSAVPSK